MFNKVARLQNGIESLRPPPLALGPQLTFRTDEIFLVVHLIDSAMRSRMMGGSESDAKSRLLQVASEADPERVASRFIMDNTAFFLPGSERGEEIEPAADTLISKLRKDVAFSDFLRESEANLRVVKNGWESNFDRSSEIVHAITGLSLAERTFDVYLTHPDIPQGRYMPPDRIAWGSGASEYDTVVYLWHEILHGALQNNDFSHALIERVADIGLRKALTGEPVSTSVSHPWLQTSHEKIEEDWRDYLKRRASGEGNIVELERSILQKYLTDPPRGETDATESW